MKRRIYLVRHGEPDLGNSHGKVYLGRKDVPLLKKSEESCQLLGRYFKRIQINGIACSPLIRCRKTAEMILQGMQSKLPIQSVDQFQEVDTGEWDGCSFSEIRQIYPQEYEDRGLHPGRRVFPGGESMEVAGKRFYQGMEKLLVETEGSLLVVAHTGVIRAFLCMITGRDIDELTSYRIPYASVTEVIYDEGDWYPVRIGFCPSETMTMEKVEQFWNSCNTTVEQRKHMKKTAELALRLIGCSGNGDGGLSLESQYDFHGTQLNANIIYYGALLHDLLRSVGRGHEKLGGEWVHDQGYFELASVISLHNDPDVWKKDRPIDEAEIIYYADKRVNEDRILSIRERFELRRSKIKTEEGRACFEKRLEAAEEIEKKLKIFGSRGEVV